MQALAETPCIRCGKVRIFKRKWQEAVKGSVIFHTETVCPDSTCQGVVDQKFAEMRDRRLGFEQRRETVKAQKSS